ncbi:type II toxin-antitoxin system Phd/YefM family antitoxin [Oceanithermus sp.]
MPASRSLQDAKNRFSEVVFRARSEGPQFVTRHGREEVVVIAVEDFRRFTAPGEDMASFCAARPWRGWSWRSKGNDPKAAKWSFGRCATWSIPRPSRGPSSLAQNRG